jgi:hypothetical protein
MIAVDATEIKILAHKYKVIYESSEMIGNPGVSNPILSIIKIGKDYSNETKSEILLHEILESILYRFNIQEEIEHEHLTLISEVLHQVLRDNKLQFYEEE